MFSGEGPLRNGAIKQLAYAVGEDVIAAKARHSEAEYYIALSGTSMATPIMTGMIATLYSYGVQKIDASVIASRFGEYWECSSALKQFLQPDVVNNTNQSPQEESKQGQQHA